MRIWLMTSKNRSSAVRMARTMSGTSQPSSARTAATSSRCAAGSRNAAKGGSGRAKLRKPCTWGWSPTAYSAAARPGAFHITPSWESPSGLGMVKPAKQ